MSVTDLLQWLSMATAAGFLVIAGLSLWEWLRFRDVGRGWLALAIGSLGLVSVAGQLARLVPQGFAWLSGDVSLALFMVSGLALLLFRDTLIPLGRRVRLAAIAITAWVTAAVMIVGLATGTARPTPVQFVMLVALVLIWSSSVGEPSLRFWLVSRRLPTVQRARLRALAGGYGAIVAILIIDVLAGSNASSTVFRVLSALVALAIVPLLYAGFAPPRWLRRLWRDSEEALVWGAIHDILMYSPDRTTLASRALQWALRVAGGEKGFIAYPGEALIAVHGVSEDDARALQRNIGASKPARVVATGLKDEPAAIVTPVEAGDAKGIMVLLSGPFTPVFGTDEVDWVAQYGSMVATGLDRVALVEAVRHQTVQAEMANRQLEAANKELEAFTYTVSHDLRAPLRAINGFTAILMDEHAAELTPEAGNYLKRVAESGKHMGALVDDLLAFSRLGRQQFKKSSVDTTQAVKAAWDRVAGNLDGRPVDFQLARLPLSLADRVLLEQVFQNLLSNALKYSAKRERIRIEVGTLPDKASGATVFYVKDNGVGFDMRYAGKLFGVFQRLHRAEDYEGTGVGLAIVQRIVQRHGGRIWAEAEPEKGATFYFTLGGSDEWQAAA